MVSSDAPKETVGEPVHDEIDATSLLRPRRKPLRSKGHLHPIVLKTAPQETVEAKALVYAVQSAAPQIRAVCAEEGLLLTCACIVVSSSVVY